MASNYKAAVPYIKAIEGGYCVGIECGSASSGETYKGIDRKYQPQWVGWNYIDSYKKQYGRPYYNQQFTQGTFAPLIQKAVEDFYTAYWNSHGLQYINNQPLANLLFAFIVHRENAAIAVVNAVARKLGATSNKSTAITPGVAAAIEANIGAGYTAVRNAIIAHYNGLKNGKTYIKNRVNVFPTSISPGTAAPATKTNAGGLFGWLFGLFGVSKLF